MQQATKIFIIGFMGSGKSTRGRQLASSLGWAFIDLDKKIEEMAGMTIPDIFSEKGETCFRRIESEALAKTLSESKTVISTGGGTPCSGDNMDFMLANGLTVYLKMTPAMLLTRLAKSPEKRPLLKNVDKKTMFDFISAKLAEREGCYSRADITVDSFNTDNSELYSLIKNYILE
jgi:shikimate kinase